MDRHQPEWPGIEVILAATVVRERPPCEKESCTTCGGWGNWARRIQSHISQAVHDDRIGVVDELQQLSAVRIQAIPYFSILLPPMLRTVKTESLLLTVSSWLKEPDASEILILLLADRLLFPPIPIDATIYAQWLETIASAYDSITSEHAILCNPPFVSLAETARDCRSKLREEDERKWQQEGRSTQRYSQRLAESEILAQPISDYLSHQFLELSRHRRAAHSGSRQTPPSATEIQQRLLHKWVNTKPNSFVQPQFFSWVAHILKSQRASSAFPSELYESRVKLSPTSSLLLASLLSCPTEECRSRLDNICLSRIRTDIQSFRKPCLGLFGQKYGRLYGTFVGAALESDALSEKVLDSTIAAALRVSKLNRRAELIGCLIKYVAPDHPRRNAVLSAFVNSIGEGDWDHCATAVIENTDTDDPHYRALLSVVVETMPTEVSTNFIETIVRHIDFNKELYDDLLTGLSNRVLRSPSAAWCLVCGLKDIPDKLSAACHTLRCAIEDRPELDVLLRICSDPRIRSGFEEQWRFEYLMRASLNKCGKRLFVRTLGKIDPAGGDVENWLLMATNELTVSGGGVPRNSITTKVSDCPELLKATLRVARMVEEMDARSIQRFQEIERQIRSQQERQRPNSEARQRFLAKYKNASVVDRLTAIANSPFNLHYFPEDWASVETDDLRLVENDVRYRLEHKLKRAAPGVWRTLRRQLRETRR